MLSSLWQWLHDTSSGQATFVGALTGSLIGFLALLAGALFNAHLNRRRDDRLRREEQRAVATALRAELAGCRRALLRNIQELKKGSTPGARAVMPELAQSIRIMPHMIPKLGLLDEETIDKVANAYLAIDEHGDMMLLFGGRLVDAERESPAAEEPQAANEETRRTGSRRLVSVSAKYVPRAIEINEWVAGTIQEAIDRMDAVLRGFRRQRPLAATAGTTKSTTSAKAK
jgi:hypothetical protein